MNILQIFPGKIWGGAEQYVLDLGHALEERAHSVNYYANDSAPVVERLSKECINVSYGTVGMSGLFHPGNRKKLLKLFREADVVHIHDVHQIAWCVLLKKLSSSDARIIVTRHIARGSHTPVWVRAAYMYIHRLIFVSDFSASLWLKANHWFPQSKSVTILNSIPPRRNVMPGNPPSLREQYKIGDFTPILVFAGRIRRSKGCETIVKALGLIKGLDYKMIFVGACKPHDYDKKLLRVAKEMGVSDSIVFHGFTDDMDSIISQADICLSPSIVKESCGLTNIEFMKGGKCVITTGNGAQKEYITDGITGFIIEPDNTEQLARIINSMISDPAKRIEVGENARKYYSKHMTYSSFVDKILEAYGGGSLSKGN